LSRTLTWRTEQLAVEPIERLEIDEASVETLAGAIRIPTVSRAETPDADYTPFVALRRYLETSFPQAFKTLAHEVVGNHSLFFTWTGEEPAAKPSLLLAHMDVVPVEAGTESAWSHGPFSGDVDQGFIWGRGTLDDKTGVMAILEAIEILLRQGFKP